MPKQRIDTQQFSQWPFVQEGETGENSHRDVKRTLISGGSGRVFQNGQNEKGLLPYRWGSDLIIDVVVPTGLQRNLPGFSGRAVPQWSSRQEAENKICR